MCKEQIILQSLHDFIYVKYENCEFVIIWLFSIGENAKINDISHMYYLCVILDNYVILYDTCDEFYLFKMVFLNW